MVKTTEDLITIVRNVTGRLDKSDPMFTDEIILGYINDFYRLEMGEDLRLNERQTWWEFSIDENTVLPLDVDLQAPLDAPAGVSFTTIGPLAYADGFRMWWWQDPGEFYWKWPETQVYQPTRPTDVLYYNNQLVFRATPNQEYAIKINAYSVEVEIPMGGSINQDYLWRYVCYGAAIDLFNDYGEDDKAQRIIPAFRNYRAQVYARTYQQNMNQRSIPRF